MSEASARTRQASAAQSFFLTMKVNTAKIKLAAISLVLALFSSGCVVAGGGYSNGGGGWFIWPGSITILIVVVILFLVLRRRR